MSIGKVCWPDKVAADSFDRYVRQVHEAKLGGVRPWDAGITTAADIAPHMDTARIKAILLAEAKQRDVWVMSDDDPFNNYARISSDAPGMRPRDVLVGYDVINHRWCVHPQSVEEIVDGVCWNQHFAAHETTVRMAAGRLVAGLERMAEENITVPGAARALLEQFRRALNTIWRER